MHRLGGVGLAAFERQQASERSFTSLSTNLSSTQLNNLETHLTQFRSALTHFASTHRDKIRKDPHFRHEFQQMCASIGVDPLSGPRGGQGSGVGGWWAELLGVGDWTFELGVQIVDICVSTRERNGGLIEMADLLRLLNKLRGTDSTSGKGAVTDEDVLRAIKTLKPLGAGYEVFSLGTSSNSPMMVRSVPRELDEDQTAVLAVARETGGKVVAALLAKRYNWTITRSRTALENMLLRDGTCWVDEQDADEEGGQSYWVPAVMQFEE